MIAGWPAERMIRADWLWLMLVGAISSLWCLSAAQQLGATFDEPTHLLEGLKSWNTGSNKQLMTWGAMPLPIDLQTLPVYLWERFQGVRFNTIEQQDRLLPIVRATTLLFWWLLLWIVYRWGLLLGGRWAARIALLGLASDPNLLGHASLATTDIALLAMVLLSSYAFAAGREADWRRRVLLPGVLYGLALATKASALPYVPQLAVVFGLHHIVHTGQLTSWRPLAIWRQTLRLRWDLVYMMLIGAVVLFTYVGSDWTTEPTFIEWVQKQPESSWKPTLLNIAENLKIFPNAGEGLVQQIKHNARGHHGSFVAGVWHEKAVWYYFPVALSIKLPETTLLLLAAVLLLRGRQFLGNAASWAVILLLLFSLTTRVQIGVRLVFPLIAFTWIALGVVCAANGSGASWSRRLLQLLAGAAILNSSLAAIQVWPDGLRYANRIWGGPDRVDQWLTDSNCDWGQGLPPLQQWWETHDQPPLHVWYYGIDSKILKHPFRWYPINTLPNPSLQGVKDQVGSGCLAVSVSLLNACPDRRPETLAIVDYLNQLEPIGRTSTFRIYRFR